jgi:hypothetical protein
VKANAQDHGNLQTLDEGSEDRFQGDRTADAHRGRPGGQRHLRQVEQRVTRQTTLTEEDFDHHSDHDDDHPQAEEEGDGT